MAEIINIKKDSFPPKKSKQGAKTFYLSCGHCQDAICGGQSENGSQSWICFTCNRKLKDYDVEEKEIPTIKSYQCWDCGMWISNIPHNKINGDLRCGNCCALNKINEIKKRDPIESRLRHEVFKRDNYKCCECGKGKDNTILHVDHIIPISRDGTDELNNLQTLCQACNLSKSNKIFKKKEK